MQAKFKYGDPITVDHTAAADIVAGEVVCTSETPRVAHLDIASGELGSLACGGGVYECDCLDANGIAEDTIVWWDNTLNGVTQDTTAGDYQFGVTVAASDSSGKVLVRHDPGA